MSDKTLAPVEQSSMQRLDNLSAQDMKLLANTVLKGASMPQLSLFAKMCARRGLDPFAREIHGKVNTDGGITAMVGIDGLRSLAEGSGEYAGQDTALYCGTDGEWREVWLGPGKPAAAKVCVRRRDRQTGEVQSTCNVALAAEVGKSTGVWNTYFSVMLATRAEAAALRRAFPRQASGLYLPDEIQDDAPQATQSAPQGQPLATADAPVVMRRVQPPVDESTGEILDADVVEVGPATQAQWKRAHELRRRLGWSEKRFTEERAAFGLDGQAVYANDLDVFIFALEALDAEEEHPISDLTEGE